MIATPAISSEPWPEIDWLDSNVHIDLTPAQGWYGSMKPAFDYFLTFLLLIPALPIIAFCWLLVRLTSSGPGFYTQVRAGRNGKSYKIIKLRTMYYNCEARSGILWSQKGDARITRIGRFLRATHFDELPQLFNVLRGEMSLVGPRPERPEVIRAKGLCDKVPGYPLRLEVKPGVTGLAQLQIPADFDVSSVRHKVVYDLYYVVNRNLWLDIRIIAATVLKSIGVGPKALRIAFFLPSRDEVASVFRSTLTPPPPPPEVQGQGSARFQPV